MAASSTAVIDGFLKPLEVGSSCVSELAAELASTFRELSSRSSDQFLPTPISESILRPAADQEQGRHLAIDM
jgi:hypothetical protein